VSLSHLKAIGLQNCFYQFSVGSVHLVKRVRLLLVIIDARLLVGEHQRTIPIHLNCISLIKQRGALTRQRSFGGLKVISSVFFSYADCASYNASYTSLVAEDWIGLRPFSRC
jgi:hypothetical protein